MALLLAAAPTLLAGCSILPADDESDEPQETAQGTVFLWVGADKDAYVSCGQAGPPCPEADRNFGRHGSLVVARSGVALKKSYVHFGLPILPSGSTVEEAYFEVYHPGQNEDGQTDDLNIPLSRAAAPWSPDTLTLSNEPNPQLTGAEFTIRLNSKNWSGSSNIADLVRAWYVDPSSNHGFYLYWDQQSPGIEKGFYSNNDIRRTADDLGRSPRLLLKVQLPDGRDSDAIQLPPLPPDNDLDFDGQEVLMVRIQGGSDWPSNWNVRGSN